MAVPKSPHLTEAILEAAADVLHVPQHGTVFDTKHRCYFSGRVPKMRKKCH